MQRCDERVEADAGDTLKGRREAEDYYLSNRLKALEVKAAELPTYPPNCLVSSASEHVEKYSHIEKGTLVVDDFVTLAGTSESRELSIMNEVLSPGLHMLPNVSLKRREPDDLVQDLLNFSFSPSKKLRVPDSGFTAPNGPGSFLPLNTPETLWGVSPGTLGSYFPLHPPGTPWFVSPETLKAAGSPVSSTKTWNASPWTPILPTGSALEDQEGGVSCRPVTPPLFPGGSAEGSVCFPAKVQVPRATNNELTSQFDCQPASSHDKNVPSDHGLFQALDLSGGPIHLSGQRRLSRVSSCSSLPRFSSDTEDQLMREEADKSADAVATHWVPKTPNVCPSKFRPIIEEMEDDMANIIDVDEMLDGDFMEVVKDDVVVSETNAIWTGEFGRLSPVMTRVLDTHNTSYGSQ